MDLKMAGAIAAKRKAGPKYRDTKWVCLDSVYVQPGLSVEKEDGKFVWFEADWDAFYSQEYLTIWKEINNSKPKGVKARGAEFSAPPDGNPRLPVQPYNPSDLDSLSFGLQRWMVNPDVLSDPDRQEFVETYVIPVDYATDPKDVCKLAWFKEHPLAFVKAAPTPASGRASKKRKLEVAEISDEEDHPAANPENHSSPTRQRSDSQIRFTNDTSYYTHGYPSASPGDQRQPPSSSPVRDEPRMLFNNQAYQATAGTYQHPLYDPTSKDPTYLAYMNGANHLPVPGFNQSYPTPVIAVT